MPQLNIGVLISGGGTNLQAIIDNINEGNINGKIVAVISNKKDAYGLTRAKDNDIDAIYINPKEFTSSDEYNKQILAEFKKRDVSLVVLAGYLKILSEEFIKTYSNKILNIHPSLIPSFCGMGYYGLKVHQKVIEYGVKVTGATVHFVNEEADAGAIIYQDTVKVADNDTAETLQQKVLKIEHRLLPLAVKKFCENKIKVDGRKVIVTE